MERAPLIVRRRGKLSLLPVHRSSVSVDGYIRYYRKSTPDLVDWKG